MNFLVDWKSRCLRGERHELRVFRRFEAVSHNLCGLRTAGQAGRRWVRVAEPDAMADKMLAKLEPG